MLQNMLIYIFPFVSILIFYTPVLFLIHVDSKAGMVFLPNFQFYKILHARDVCAILLPKSLFTEK